MSTTQERGLRKLRTGVVLSATMDKTLVVRVDRRVRHPLYGKEIRRVSKIYVHDAENEARAGDRVRVVETRPLSRMKRWRLLEITRKAD